MISFLPGPFDIMVIVFKVPGEHDGYTTFIPQPSTATVLPPAFSAAYPRRLWQTAPMADQTSHTVLYQAVS